MNKYQKQINKTTKKIIKHRINSLNVATEPLRLPHRGNGKSSLHAKMVLEYCIKLDKLNSNSYYREVRRSVKCTFKNLNKKDFNISEIEFWWMK